MRGSPFPRNVPFALNRFFFEVNLLGKAAVPFVGRQADPRCRVRIFRLVKHCDENDDLEKNIHSSQTERNVIIFACTDFFPKENSLCEAVQETS